MSRTVLISILFVGLAAAMVPTPISGAVPVGPDTSTGRALGPEIIVGPDGPVRSVAEAVRMADPQARIVIRPGTYEESGIRIDKPLSLIGSAGTVIQALDGEQIVVIAAEGVSIEGITFRGVSTSFIDDRSAIRVEQVSDCRITQNRFEDTFFGVYLARSEDCVIRDNTFHALKRGQTRSGNAIHLWNASDIVIRNNFITGHRDGIYLEFSSRVAVEGNRSERNLRYGLHFMFSDSCRYRDNAFVDNHAGVAVMYSKAVEMTRNRFVDNWGASAFGLLLKDITDSRISGNLFRSNTVGIFAEGANRIEVSRNDFESNGRALKLMANSMDSVIRDNNFLSNTFDVTTNSRQSFSTFVGNYWDAYRGYDLNRDGTGEVPFYPVRLFALLAERHEATIILLRSPFVGLLDAAERVLPALTPSAVVDERPRMRPVPTAKLSTRKAAPQRGSFEQMHGAGRASSVRRHAERHPNPALIHAERHPNSVRVHAERHASLARMLSRMTINASMLLNMRAVIERRDEVCVLWIR